MWRWQIVSKYVQVVQKWLGMNTFVRSKSRPGSKFLQNIFGAFVYVMDCSCAPILPIFSAESDGATADRQIPNSKFSSLS